MAAVAAALPVELHLDAVVAVGMDGFAQAHHEGGLHAGDGGPQVQARVGLAVGVARHAAHGHGEALGRELALVERLFGLAGQVRAGE